MGESLRRDVTFSASGAGPLLRRCAVCVTRSLRRIEGFAEFQRGALAGLAFAKRITALRVAVAKVQGLLVPEALEGLKGPWLALGPRSPGPADTGRLPRRHFPSAAFRRAVAGAMTGAPCFPEAGGRAAKSGWVKALCSTRSR